MRAAAAAVLAVALTACAGAPRRAAPGRVLTGLDVLEAEGFAPLRGKRVGVIANRSAVDREGRPILDVLAEAPGVRLVSVFSPEHGFLGDTEASAAVGRGTATVAGTTVTVVSLYRGGLEGMRPPAEDLRGLDALVFDIQDVGARFYTYPTTMAMAMEASKAAGVEFFVLDRPDPVGGDAVEGPLPDEPGLLGFSSVAYLPVATRHGMTMGELARLHDATVRHPRLRVIAMKGWRRAMWFDDTGLPWIPPSPNMPDLDAAALYPGVANLEFTNLSVGRGTPAPFGWIGAPWFDATAAARVMSAAGLAGVTFSAQTWTPTKDKYAGQAVPGLRMTVTDRKAVRPLRVFSRLAAFLRDRHSADFQLNWPGSRKLIGGSVFKTWYDSGEGPEALDSAYEALAEGFRRTRAPYLLYEDRGGDAAEVPSVKDLSVEELAGQVFMIALDTDIAREREADIRAGRLGGGLLRWDRFTGDEARDFAREMRRWSRESPHRVPFWLSTDHEGGPTFTQRLYGLPAFPGNMALGAAGSADLAYQDARETARELRALGISVTFAPALDVNSDPLNPIIGLRSFGEDPAEAARLGAAAVRGYRDGGILAAVKHFPGHGDTRDDSHLGLPFNGKSLDELEKTELVPFRAALKAGARAVMPAHMVFPALGDAPGQPVTLSSAAIQGFLRDRLGFRGLVFSDSLDMGAIAGAHGSAEAAVLALLAGDDVLLLGKGDFPSAFAAVVAAVKSGRLPRARLEASVARILDAKRRLGLFDDGPVAPGVPPAELERGRELARKTAEAAVTMARNDGLLPLRLKPSEELALVVVHSTRYSAEAARFAAEVARRHPRTTFIDVPAVAPAPAAVEDAVAQARGAAAVVVGTWRYGGGTPESQAELVRRLVAGPAPVAAVSLMNPYDLDVSSGAAAALAAYGMTDSALDAAARLLFGEIPARGKLPVSVPGLGASATGKAPPPPPSRTR